jgi:hypothetical protein
MGRLVLCSSTGGTCRDTNSFQGEKVHKHFTGQLFEGQIHGSGKAMFRIAVDLYRRYAVPQGGHRSGNKKNRHKIE